MSDEIRAEITNAAKALCHYPSGPSSVCSCCQGIPRCEMAAAIAEIARLRAAMNDALTAPWPDPELNSTWHQEPIGPNETPEEAIKRLVRVRAEWAVYKNNCENPEIAELRAALATARREGMEDAAQKALIIASVLSSPSAQNALRSFADAIRAAAQEVKP